MLKLEVLIFELGAVDALASSAVASGKVTALDHELFDDTMEGAALVVQRLASLSETLLASAEGTEVVGCLGDHIVVELKSNAAGLLLANLDVEEDATALFGVGGHDMKL